MPIASFEDVVFMDNTGGYRRNGLTEPMPIVDVEMVTLWAFRSTEHRDGGITSVQPKLLVSGDGGRTYATTGVLPNSGSIVTSGLTPDLWHPGPWVWILDWADANFYDKTHFRIALELLGERFGFCRAQAEYSVRRRPVQRVPCYRRVIANADGAGRWRLTDPIQPHVETGHLRATIAIHALTQMSGTGTVRPIWFYNDSPGDETGWTYGGSLHNNTYSTTGTFTTRPIEVTGLTDHPLIAFGFEVLRTAGTSGHTVFALVEGTFAVF